jgi:hypothetical protein
MSSKREYKLKIDAQVLKILGPSLYTNIYYVLAEIIANAYDADANNVYIYADDDILSVEDDGVGMSYSEGDVDKYLEVGKESRSSISDSFTACGRLKMGRKGIGKLAALSVSDDVTIHTISESGERSGFILSTTNVRNNTLQPVEESRINLPHNQQHGTLVQMRNPKLELHKTLSVVKKHLARLFPVIGDDFAIHIDLRGETSTIDSYDDSLIPELSALITLGDSFGSLSSKFRSTDEEKRGNFLRNRAAYSETILLETRDSKFRDYELKIEGWIGTYRSMRGRRRKNFFDFPENYISLLSHGKVGEFNILPQVGSNRLGEAYVVGQLHVDLFEDSSLPDMALSNRQGYLSDDKRYRKVLQYVSERLLPEIVSMREQYTDAKKSEAAVGMASSDPAEKNRVASNTSSGGDAEGFNDAGNEDLMYEEKLENDFRRDFSSSLEQELTYIPDSERDSDTIQRISTDIFDTLFSKRAVPLKPTSDDRKILISHTSDDTDLADALYEMLTFNNIPRSSIIYTSSTHEESRIPSDGNIYDYLRYNFFVPDRSQAIRYVIFVTSEDMRKSWGAVTEVGAAWISGSDHSIFNINNFTPEFPLNVAQAWINCARDDKNGLTLSETHLDAFAARIELIADRMNCNKKSRTENKQRLRHYFKPERSSHQDAD